MATIQKPITLEGMVTGFMMYCQEERGIKNFPLFDDEKWHMFLGGYQAVAPKLMPATLRLEFEVPKDAGANGFPMVRGYEDVALALSVLANIDREAKRMRLKENSPSGREFLQQYRYLAEDMFDHAHLYNRGFLQSQF